VKLYNDAYASILGSKHPAALGSPGRKVWPEIWDVIGPMLDHVMTEGAAIALEHTLAYVKQRRAFGQPVCSFQNSRFVLAEIATEVDLAQTYVDRCVRALDAGELTPEDAAKAKWWCTELQGRVLDRCLQLHGGYGYMTEYPIARAYADARSTRIYGGTTEIMKEVVGRSLGL